MKSVVLQVYIRKKKKKKTEKKKGKSTSVELIHSNEGLLVYSFQIKLKYSESII